jgi:N-acetylmuramoyl-L-alanine amidase
MSKVRLFRYLLAGIAAGCLIGASPPPTDPASAGPAQAAPAPPEAAPVDAGTTVPSTAGTPAAPDSSGVRAVRFWTAPDYTRIVIDLGRYPDFSFSVAPDSAHVTVTIRGVPLPEAVVNPVQDGLVGMVRFSAVPGGIQAEIDLLIRGHFAVFPLAKAEDIPDRLVIDATRSVPTAEMQAQKRQAAASKARKERIVVVDAGHGGDDPGARYYKVREKDICLAIANKLVAELNTRKGIRAFLTRKGDYFIPLRKRIQIAEDYQADLFVSIHTNASRNRSARGTEVYFLSLSGATDEASRELADRENAADLFGGVIPEEDDLLSILYDLKKTDTLNRSSLLASSVVEGLGRINTLDIRGVKQAGFAVLKSPRFPSILVETAFLSNRGENRLLVNAAFQKSVSQRIADGVVKYIDAYGIADSHP